MSRVPVVHTPTPIGYSTSTAPLSGGPNVLSGTPLNPSGYSPTSGPHAIERQSLEIVYARVPKAHQTNPGVSLDSASCTYQIDGTYLQAVVKASYSMTKSTDFFNSSSFQQPQQFQILSTSTDAEGNSYGTPDTSSLGPTGKVITSQPWYKRVPWDANIHTESASSVQGVSFGSVTSGVYQSQGTLGISHTINPYEDVFGTYLEVAIPYYKEGTFINGHPQWHLQYDAKQLFWLNGNYTTSQETKQEINDFITEIGSLLKNDGGMTSGHGDGLVKIPQVNTNFYAYQNEQNLTTYDPNRHDYSSS
tara:strand:- start:27 stop:941 length:915 start_codon:yes stop_codon:yes gene_type:complete